MNSPRDFLRTSMVGLPAVRPALNRASSFHLTRAGLPVVSNRAFIGAWATRRPKLVPATQLRIS